MRVSNKMRWIAPDIANLRSLILQVWNAMTSHRIWLSWSWNCTNNENGIVIYLLVCYSDSKPLAAHMQPCPPKSPWAVFESTSNRLHALYEDCFDTDVVPLSTNIEAFEIDRCTTFEGEWVCPSWFGWPLRPNKLQHVWEDFPIPSQPNRRQNRCLLSKLIRQLKNHRRFHLNQNRKPDLEVGMESLVDSSQFL